MDLESGLVIAGKYRIEQQLAAGGMGSLWVARHLQLDVPIAVKFMDPANADSPVAQQRFEREARAAANLRSMHIVHIQDYGVTDGVPYIVMELLHGEDLGRRLKRHRRLPLAQTAKILTQTAKGLRRAHEAGVVHRDLKPANIFLARTDTNDDEDIVKLLDFGVAKEMMAAINGESTRTGELIGSPHYMSPEQIRGARDLDYRSDLWSLGVILYRSITGYLPFTGDAIGEVMAKIIADPLPVATKVAPDLPPSIDAFFERAFAREREHRFQSARELADAFAMLSHQMVPTLWTGEFPRPALHPRPSPSGAPPQWSFAALQNLPRPAHPAHLGHAGEPNGVLSNSVNSASALARYTPISGSVSSSGELTPAPPSISLTRDPGYGSSLSTPETSSMLAPTDGSFSSTGMPNRALQLSLNWSPAWFGAVAGLAVVAIGFTFFALRDAAAPASGEPAPPPSVEAPLLIPSESPSVAGAAPTASAALSASARAPAPSASATTSAARSTSPAPLRQQGPRQTVVRPNPPPASSGNKKKPPVWGF
jgi:eukaryotic-like serine/threonine-protein kinase